MQIDQIALHCIALHWMGFLMYIRIDSCNDCINCCIRMVKVQKTCVVRIALVM